MADSSQIFEIRERFPRYLVRDSKYPGVGQLGPA